MIASERGKGIAAMLSAGVIWGLSSIFYKEIAHIPAIEVASHRALWSFLTFSSILVFRRQIGQVLFQFTESWRKLCLTLLAAIMISVNWLVWILSIQLGYATEGSLGYFIFPLFAVALGALVFREQLKWLQWLAVAVAIMGVMVLAVGLGTAPWIALILASTFSVYGMLKKRSEINAVVSVAAEAGLVTPFALTWLFGVHYLGWTGITESTGGYFGSDLVDTIFLILSGALTAGPLILISYATQRLGYAEVGLLQYINPTLQFLVAIFMFLEPFTNVHLVAFFLIWSALGLYSIDLLRHHSIRSRRISTAFDGDSAK